MTEYAEKKMYGMTAADIRSQYMESLTAKLSGQEMVVMSILSDCQELLSYTNDTSYPATEEAVRKLLNVAKFILCEMQDTKEAV